MTSIMLRSFADAWGFEWPKELAMIVNGERITWAQIGQAKKAKQARRLQDIRRHDGPVTRAAHVWTFYVEGFPYGGWHLYIRTLKDRWWIRDANSYPWEIGLELMRTFPCGILPLPENFYRWKEAFAEAYPRPGRFKRQGLLLGLVETGSNGWPRHFTPINQELRAAR